MNWVASTPQHLLHINSQLSRDLDMEQWIMPIVHSQELSTLMSRNARTLMVDDTPVMAIGCWPVWEGVGQIWMFVTPDIKPYGRRILRGVRRFMKDLVDRDKYHRLHAWVFPQNRVAIKFVEHFGFHMEGCMYQYTQKKEDMLLFARIF